MSRPGEAPCWRSRSSDMWRVVTETLVEALWSDNTKRSRATLQVHINRLRDLLGEECPPTKLVTVPGAYRLVVAPDELDTLDFEDRVVRAAGSRGQGSAPGTRTSVELCTVEVPDSAVDAALVRDRSARLSCECAGVPWPRPGCGVWYGNTAARR